jgi:hypothetical protein
MPKGYNVVVTTFPSDIRGCMKDAILAVIWPKDDIFRFLRDHGCTKADVRSIEGYKDLGISRSAIVDSVFDALVNRADGGLGVFRAMLQSLLTWSRFDPYYFEKLKKLDRAKAEQTLAHLRQLQEIRDAKISSEREKRTAAESREAAPDTTLPDVRNEFFALHAGKLPHQKRGYALERILATLAKLSALEVTEPFRVCGEQIDGAVKFEGEHYIVEAKWEDAAASNEPVYQFVGKVEGKMYGRGIFVSVQGFSENVVKSVVIGKAIKTIFIDGEDLTLVLEGQLTFAKLLDVKIKAAQTRGEIYIHPITGASKLAA